ncbi:hypothetical protein F5B18DRAFT_628363 [Nemania serpens]|nr:hypothetical protein F5B18DRAFT_628363 [Nemania serpens]
MSIIYSVPREKRYGSKYKNVLYLEPPFNGAVTMKRRVTTIVPPPQPPPPPPAFMPVRPEPEPVPSIIDVAPPRAPHPPPAFMPEHESPIDVIAVDVDPSEAGSIKSSRTSKSSKSSRSSKRHSRSRDCEVYVERERLVPVPVRVPVPYPVPAEPQYDTFRYVEAPRHYEPRRRSLDHDIIIEDHHRRHYIRDC